MTNLNPVYKPIVTCLFFGLSFLHLRNTALAGTQKDTIIVAISADTKNLLQGNKVIINFAICNKTKQAIKIPNFFYFGLGNDPYADIVLELQKKEDSVFVPFPPKEDYLPTYREIALIELKKDAGKTGYCDIAFFYSRKIPSGYYRIRFLFKLSKYNKINNLSSNWLEFDIGKIL